jgi:hypothetical protein
MMILGEGEAARIGRDPDNHQGKRRHRYPGSPGRQGATRFIGVAPKDVPRNLLMPEIAWRTPDEVA